MFFYYHAIPFNIIRLVDFIMCVMDTTRMNKTYAPSSYEALQSTLLMEVKTMVETIVAKVHSKNAKYKCIIC